MTERDRLTGRQSRKERELSSKLSDGEKEREEMKEMVRLRDSEK